MKGTQLCCRFSSITNKLAYCGPSNSHKFFEEHIKTGAHEAEVKDLLSKFEGLYPYLYLIAERHSLNPFDYEVIEAYWLGNKLLDAFTKEDFKKFLPQLEKRGLPHSMVQRLISNLPEVTFPHHTFNVLFVGVGRITSSVPTNITNMQNCMVSWAKVLNISDAKLSIKGPVLQSGFLLSEAERAVNYNKEIIQPKKGDIVAVHWNEAMHILTENQLKNLEKYTNKVIESVNSIPPNSQ